MSIILAFVLEAGFYFLYEDVKMIMSESRFNGVEAKV